MDDSEFRLMCDYMGQLRVLTKYTGGCSAIADDGIVFISFGDGITNHTITNKVDGDHSEYYAFGGLTGIPQFSPTDPFTLTDEVFEYDTKRSWELPWPKSFRCDELQGFTLFDIHRQAAEKRLRAYMDAGLPLVNPRLALGIPEPAVKYLKGDFWLQMIEYMTGNKDAFS